MSDDKPQASGDAIGARREQIKAADRPQRLNEGFSIKDAVQDVRETVDLVKLYHHEWITVFTSHARGEEGRKECEAQYDKKYEGRVFEDDVKIAPILGEESDIAAWPHVLQLHLPNVVGEFKRVDLAQAERDRRGWQADEAPIVARNSRDEYKLREYGTKKLVSTKRGLTATGRAPRSTP